MFLCQGPDNQLGYSWTVYFLETEGDVLEIEVGSASLTGDGSNAIVKEVRRL